MIAHPIAPVWDERCRVLVLGSFPSVASRAVGFYYGHPQNRFWRLLGALYRTTVPPDTPGKIDFLLAHHIALWDVIASCEITGSADSAIRHALPNDLLPLLTATGLQRVYCNGQKAAALYRTHQQPLTGLPAVTLPSTSPANAAWSLERLEQAWKIIL